MSLGGTSSQFLRSPTKQKRRRKNRHPSKQIALGNLLTLSDGKSQTTTWVYNLYGRITNIR